MVLFGLEQMITGETAPFRELLDPHIAWAIACLLLALAAAVAALLLGQTERRR
jgi:hypothetical protein